MAKRVRKFGGGRTNLLEELGRVEGERSNKNRRAEISRVHGELNRGYAKGGRAGYAIGTLVKGAKKIVKKISDAARKKATADRIKKFEHAGPHEGEVITKRILGKSTKKGDRTKAAVKDAMKVKEIGKEYGAKPHATGGRVGLKTGLLARRGIGLHEQFGGGVKGKPHSTKEGRIASGKRRLERFHRKAMNDYHDEQWAGKDPEKGKPHSSQEGRIATGRRNFKRAFKKQFGVAEGGRIGLKHGGGGAQQHYLQHGYGPYKLKMAKASDKATKGNKLTKKA